MSKTLPKLLKQTLKEVVPPGLSWPVKGSPLGDISAEQYYKNFQLTDEKADWPGKGEVEDFWFIEGGLAVGYDSEGEVIITKRISHSMGDIWLSAQEIIDNPDLDIKSRDRVGAIAKMKEWRKQEGRPIRYHIDDIQAYLATKRVQSPKGEGATGSINVSVTQKMRAEIEELAEKKNLSLSAWGRQAIEQSLAAQTKTKTKA